MKMPLTGSGIFLSAHRPKRSVIFPLKGAGSDYRAALGGVYLRKSR